MFGKQLRLANCFFFKVHQCSIWEYKQQRPKKETSVGSAKRFLKVIFFPVLVYTIWEYRSYSKMAFIFYIFCSYSNYPPYLILKLKDQKKILPWTRQKMLICMKNKRILKRKPFWNKVYQSKEAIRNRIPMSVLSMYSTLTSAPIKPNSRGWKNSQTIAIASAMGAWKKIKDILLLHPKTNIGKGGEFFIFNEGQNEITMFN